MAVNRLTKLLVKIKPLGSKVNVRLLYTLLSATFILVGTFLAIQYAKGNYRLTQQGFAPNTGLLSANSFPTGAEVYIDNRLVTATNDTLYLEPGEYQVKVAKDGYSPWEKKLLVEKELVTQTNAHLFPSAPSLTPLTFTGVTNVSPSPDGQKIIYYTDSASSTNKNGLFLLELSNNFIPLQRGPKQITDISSGINLAEANLIWSPDSTELLILGKNREVLIALDKKYQLDDLPDIGWKKKVILSEWEEEMYLREREFLSKFPPEIIKIATQSAKNVYLSPDKKRILYTATEDTIVPETIISPLPASNTQPEVRELKAGSIYIYDREEDKNFQIAVETGETDLPQKYLLATDLHQDRPRRLESSPSSFLTLQATNSAQTTLNFNVYHSSLFINTLQWFPNSKHVIFIKDDRIQIMEYDSTNNTTVYSGPFVTDFIYPWPDGSKLLIMTSFSPDSPMNLYAIELE